MGAFADKVKAFADKAEKRKGLTMRESILLLTRQFVDRSPVGDPSLWASKPDRNYRPGTFKANWQGGDGAINFTVTDDADPSGEISMVSVASKIPSTFDGTPFYITNSVPYAYAIEHGWSKQAPSGVVALARLSWQNTVDIAATSVIGGVVK